MVVAANSRAQTNHRTLVLCGASAVRPVARKLAVLLDTNRTPAVARGDGRLQCRFRKPMLPAAAGSGAGLRLRRARACAGSTLCMVFVSRREDNSARMPGMRTGKRGEEIRGAGWWTRAPVGCSIRVRFRIGNAENQFATKVLCPGWRRRRVGRRAQVKEL